MDKLIFKFTFLFLLFISCYAYALKEDQKQVLLISAERADFNQKNHKAIFKGNIEIIQGSTHLVAHEIHAVTDENNNINLAIAFGNNKKQAHYWTLPEKDKEILHAYANKIYFYPHKHLIKLMGQAQIKQENNTFKAPIILFVTEKQNIISESNEKEKIKITLHHEKKS